MSIFFDAFWPNLASTLAGVILGVPVALSLNQRGLKHQRKLQIDDARIQVKGAIDVLIDACRYNIKVLDIICSDALCGRVMHNPDLRITTWEAVGQILCNSSSDPELLQLLSHHWLRLHRLQGLSEEIFSREIAKSLPPIENQSIAQDFWRILYENSFNLSAHAGEAIKRLEALKASLSSE